MALLFLLLVELIACSAMLTPANAKSKYIKVKADVVKNYKSTIKKQKKTIIKLKKKNTLLSETNIEYEAEIKRAQEAEDKYKGINDWLYNTLINKCGYKYDKNTKTWSATGIESIECLDCHTHFAHQPKGETKYKYCPRCGSDNLDN